VTRLPGTLVFAAAAIVVALAAVLMAIDAYQHRDSLRIGIAVILAGLGLDLVYETGAYALRKTPTISWLAATEFLRHPFVWLTSFAALLFLAGLLAGHFTEVGRQDRWWVLLLGLGSMVLGWIVAERTGWVPLAP
jgi:chromate transport protein ChrA